MLGTPGLKLPRQPAVFIPVGTPGVDENGRLVRCDSVVSLPLKNLHRAELPRVADVLELNRSCAVKAGSLLAMVIKLSGGKVYDPANKVSGEVRDIYVEDGKIVAAPGRRARGADLRS